MDWKKWFWETNESGWDRTIRLVLGVILLYVFYKGFVVGWLNYVVLLLSIIGIYTGLVGHCLIYTILGIKTSE